MYDVTDVIWKSMIEDCVNNIYFWKEHSRFKTQKRECKITYILSSILFILFLHCILLSEMKFSILVALIYKYILIRKVYFHTEF